MKIETITVYYNDSAMLVNKSVARNLNIVNGYRVKSETEFWDILSANASQNIALLNAEKQKSDN